MYEQINKKDSVASFEGWRVQPRKSKNLKRKRFSKQRWTSLRAQTKAQVDQQMIRCPSSPKNLRKCWKTKGSTNTTLEIRISTESHQRKNTSVIICFKCKNPRHIKTECPKLRIKWYSKKKIKKEANDYIERSGQL